MCGRQSLRALPRTPPTTRFYNHPSPSKKPPNSAGGMTHPRKMCFNNLQAAYPHLNRLRPGWWELVGIPDASLVGVPGSRIASSCLLSAK